MASHAPYIMPDGRSLMQYLSQEREREQLRRRKVELRGKDLQLVQLIRQRTSTMSEMELAELKAMENAGVRRRRRWLNDKTLRDLAGPLSAADMEAQFKPVPFGVAAPSPLAQAMSPANAAVWDNFRNIDPEKEARVLQKWAAHQRESAPRRQRPLSQAALALQRWAAIGKKARSALKRANPSSVMQLELQILDFFEQAGPSDQLLLPLEDAFARLLVHGLAEFYGLLSCSRPHPDTGATAVAVYRRTRPLPDGEPKISLGLGTATPSPTTRKRHEAGGSQPQTLPARRSGSAASPGPSPSRGSLVGPSPARSDRDAPAPAGPAQPSPSPSPSPGREGAGSTAATTTSGGRALSSASPQSRQAGRPVSAGAGIRDSTVLVSGRGCRSGSGSAGRQHAPEGPVDHEVTCTDVLLAMAEVGQMALNEEALRRYVHVHIHGTPVGGGGGSDEAASQYHQLPHTRLHTAQHCGAAVAR